LSYLLVNTTNLEQPGQVSHLELINLRGDSLADLAITRDHSSHNDTLYNSSAFFPPETFFYIKV